MLRKRLVPRVTSLARLVRDFKRPIARLVTLSRILHGLLRLLTTPVRYAMSEAVNFCSPTRRLQLPSAKIVQRAAPVAQEQIIVMVVVCLFTIYQILQDFAGKLVTVELILEFTVAIIASVMTVTQVA